MPIYLDPPERRPASPDGQGWNRLSLNAHGEYVAQCALRPRSYPALYESQNTHKAAWGPFGVCVADGRCDQQCPIAAAQPATLKSFGPDVLVRLMPRGSGGAAIEPHIMNQSEKGWESSSRVWTWDDLAQLQGWRLGRAHRDEHGEGFWLHATGGPVDGVYGG